MALPPLLVKIGAETKGLNEGLKRGEVSIAKFAAAGVTAASAVGAAFLALAKSSMNNIDAQAKLARAVGGTVTGLQALERAGSRAGVQQSELASATTRLNQRLGEVITTGKGATETFAALGLTAQELADMDVDERFMAISDAMKNAGMSSQEMSFHLRELGIRQASVISLIQSGSGEISRSRAVVERFGVAVSEIDAANIERANDAMSEVGRVIEGIGNQLAVKLAPSVEAAANAFVEFAAAMIGAKTRLEDFFVTAGNAAAILGEDVYKALNNNTSAVMDNAASLRELATIYGVLQGPIHSTINSLSAFADHLRNIGSDEAADEMEALVDQMEALEWQFKNGGLTAQEYDAALQGVIDRADNLVESLKDVSKVGYSGAIRNLGDLRVALQLAAADAARLVASLPGAGGGQTTGTGLTVGDGDLLPPSLLAPTESLRPQMPGIDASFGTPEPSRGGGGGGEKSAEDILREQMAARLEVLMEGLMTERETVQTWYDESLALIQNASDAELAAIGGKQEAIERLEREHQGRLARIRDLGAAAELHSVLGAGKEVLTALGENNKKALRVAKVFGAAQALISAYQGAAEALKLPFPANLAAAATVLAKGIGFVTAIRGVNSSGGAPSTSGGGGGGASAAPAAAPQQQNVQTLNLTFTNDPFGIGPRIGRQMLDAMNQATRDGGTLITGTVR